MLTGGLPAAGVARHAAPLLRVSGRIGLDQELVNRRADLDLAFFEGEAVYSGSDLRVLVEPALYEPGGQPPRQLVELTTLTVSVHREKAPVRACGYINPKGFARGRRTIAGTMVLTQFHIDSLYRFLRTLRADDYSRDSFYTKPDQLPAFHMLLVFANESGFVSWRRLMGVEILTDGTVYSVHDLYAEQSVTYMASDFTPLLPASEPAVLPRLPAWEPTPKSAIGVPAVRKGGL